MKVTKESETLPGNCQCGRPLHYTNASIREKVQAIISKAEGPFVTVWFGDKAYRVQRHFIALHGISLKIAESYGFEQATFHKGNNK